MILRKNAFILVATLVAFFVLGALPSYAFEKGALSQRILFLFNSKSTPPQVESQTSIPIQGLVTPTPLLAIVPPPRDHYKIAVIGDSMVDTMGEALEYLEKGLKKRYPSTKFTLYNFGQGAQNIEDAQKKILNEFHYKDRDYPSLLTIQPDILVIGSYAYNPLSPFDSSKYRAFYEEYIKTAKGLATEVYILAEISPLRGTFGRGPHGVNWDSNTAYIHSSHIIEQLESSIEVAKKLNIPIINAYLTSIGDPRSKEGKALLVNTSDGIHPSVKGHEFMAELIVQTIQLK